MTGDGCPVVLSHPDFVVLSLHSAPSVILRFIKAVFLHCIQHQQSHAGILPLAHFHFLLDQREMKCGKDYQMRDYFPEKGIEERGGYSTSRNRFISEVAMASAMFYTIQL